MKTLGEFYREKILSRDDLIIRDLPMNRGESNVVKDLFGWKLYSGKEVIECSSKEEARYLKVFYDAGMTEIAVPGDQEFLASIVDELENMKKRIDQIINQYLNSVMSRKIREQVRYEVYQELVK